MCDELTQLYNRYKMRDIFTAALEGFSTGRFKFSITIADIDDFKKFNDTYGHEAGDFILRETAQILLQHAHQYSWSEVDSNTIDCPDLIVSRWGGEEFLIVQTYKDSIDESIKISKKKLQNILFYIKAKIFILLLQQDAPNTNLLKKSMKQLTMPMKGFTPARKTAKTRFYFNR